MEKRKSKRPKRIIYRIWNSAQRVWQLDALESADKNVSTRTPEECPRF